MQIIIRQIAFGIVVVSLGIAFTWEIASVMRPEIVAGSSLPFLAKVAVSAAVLSLIWAGVWFVDLPGKNAPPGPNPKQGDGQ